MSSQASFNYDICANKHHDAANSVAANPAPATKEGKRQTILGFIVLRPKCIHQLHELTGWGLNEISPRLSELRHDLGLITDSGRKCVGHGKGAAIYERVSR